MKIIVKVLLIPCLLLISFINYKKNSKHISHSLIDVQHKLTLRHLDAQQQIEVRINDQLFTAYHYADTLEKPFLYPIHTTGGIAITRGFPIDPQPGDRVDHPHHVGCWMNYGDVNGLDFWNNSYAVPAERKDRYGTIRHKEIVALESEENQGRIIVRMEWLTPDGEVLLDEETVFDFMCEAQSCTIKRISTLTARDKVVNFDDNKEGFFAIRMARELEHISDKPATLWDESGSPSTDKIVDNTGVSGSYLSSEGIRGTDVWGQRAKWMKLSGIKASKPVQVIILDHPQNPGYPTYWHARGYGLFAANPLGQKIFSNDKEVFNFQLKPNASTTFKFQVLIHEGGEFSNEQIEQAFQAFSGG